MRVVRWQDVTPHMRRITLTGRSLDYLDSPSMHVRLLFPTEQAQEWPYTGADGRLAWRPGQHPMISRVYTIRNVRADIEEVDIDFVLHGDEGVASGWAAHVGIGQAIGLAGPIGRRIPEADWYLLAGDETALSPMARIIEQLPGHAQGIAVIEIDGPDEEQTIDGPPGLTIRWVHRNGGTAGQSSLLQEAALSVAIPANANIFCWLGAERASFVRIRDHWLDRCKIDKSQTLAVAYWRYGSEQFKAEAPTSAAQAAG